MNIRLIALLLIANIASIRAGEEPADVVVREEKQRLEKQKNQLEEEQRQLKQEAAQATNQKELDQIRTDQESTAQELQEVEAQLASTPQVAPVLPSDSSIIPVQEITPEQDILRSKNAEDWIDDWKKYTERPGKIWGKGGELFAKVSPSQRAAKIVDILEKTPVAVLSQDTAQAIATLLSIGQLADYLKQENELSPTEPDKDYDQILDAVTKKVGELIEKGFLPGDVSEQIANWYTSAYDPIESSNLPDYAKTYLVEAVTKRLQQEFTQKEQPLSPLAAIAMLGNIRKQVDTLLKDHFGAQIALRKTLFNEVVKILNDTSFEKQEQGAKSLNQVAQAILIYATPDPKAQAKESNEKSEAEIVITNRFVLYLERLSLDQREPVDLAGQLIKEYGALIESFRTQLPQQAMHKIGSKIIERINPIIEQIKGESIDDFNSLMDIVQVINKEDASLLPSSASTLQHIANKMNNIITVELDNHTLIADAVAKAGVDGYSVAYKKEIELLKQYLGFLTQYSQRLQKIPELELGSAKRLTRLNDFIEAQMKPKNQGLVRWALSGIVSLLSSAIGFFGTPDAVTQLINKSDTLFTPAETAQKAIFAKGALEALPEDMLASLVVSIDQTLQKIGTAKEDEFKSLFSNLINLHNKLYEPLIDDEGKYGYDKLLINNADITRLKDTKARVGAKVVQLFNDEYLPSVVDEQGGLGQTAERKKAEDNLKKMKEQLETVSFEKVPGASDLLKKIDKVFKATQKQDVQDGKKLVKQIEDVLSEAAQPNANLISYKDSLDRLIENLEDTAQNLGGATDVDIQDMSDALSEAQAWRDLISMAEVVPTLTQGAQAEDVYTSLIETTPNIQFLIDYRSKEDFDARIDTMKKQARALGKVGELFGQQKVGAQSMSDLSAALYTFRENLEEQPPTEMIPILKSLGYITETEHGVISLTEAGNNLADIAREQTRIAARKEQLEKYIKTYEGGAAPAKGLTVENRSVSLAESINYSWLILDDQLTALKQSYTQRLGDPLEQTMVNMNKGLEVRVATIEDSMARIAEIAGIKAENQKELKTIVGTGKQLGFSADITNDPKQLAAKLGIVDVDNPQVIGKLLGMTDDELKKASPESLSFMQNENVRWKILQIEVVKQALDKQLAVQAKERQDIPAIKLMLRDIDDMLKDQKKQLGQLEPVDPYFEALISLKLQMLNMPEKEETWSSSETLLMLLGALDGSVALQIDPHALTGDMKTIATEIGGLMKGSIDDLAVWGMKQWLNFRMGAGTVVQYSSVPLAVVSMLLTALTVRASTTALTGGVAGVVTGSPAVAATVSTATSTGYLPEFIGLLTGATAGGLLYYLGSKIKPSQETILEMNKTLLSRGLDPSNLAKDEVLAKSAWQRFKDLFKNKMTVRLQTAGDQKEFNQGKADLALNARKDFYDMLGVSPQASRIEVEQAIRYRQAVMETHWGITRWLMARRFNKQYRIMLRRSYDALESQMNYMKMLNGIALKSIQESEQDKAGVFSMLGDWWDKMTKDQPPISEQLLQKQQFEDFKTKLERFYKEQIANLDALKTYVDTNSDAINKATPFSDTMYSDMFKALIDGRISNISDAYQQGFLKLLVELGATPAQLAPVAKEASSTG